MKLAWSTIVLAALAGEKVSWERPEQAPASAAAAGKPVCYYFLTNEMVKGASES